MGLYPQTSFHMLYEGNQSPVTAVKALISCCDIAQAGCSTAQPGGFWFSSTILSQVAVDRADAEPHLQGGDTVATRCSLKVAQGRQTGCLQAQLQVLGAAGWGASCWPWGQGDTPEILWLSPSAHCYEQLRWQSFPLSRGPAQQ